MESGISDTQAGQPRIARLPSQLIDQIAAGEVVERPASVIKELVENSLDAGSSQIDILLTDGGIREIVVIDNGIGMGSADLRLCVERHTTSKLRDASELESIRTFGFRGEALSSIASVSEMEIRSRTREMAGGHVVPVTFGEVGELSPTGTPPGTRITVRNLFDRVPVRKKFLRPSSTELSQCSRVVKELALGNPGIRMTLHHQGRLVAQYSSMSREARLRECLRPDWSPLHLEETVDGARLEAFLCPPEATSPRAELYLFINGRAVRNRNLMVAIRNAYLDVLGTGREPSGAIYLDLRHDWVDVNVHPQKLEVRCLRQETLYPWFLSSTKKLLFPHVEAPVAAYGPFQVAEPSVPDYSPIGASRWLGKYRGHYDLAETTAGLCLVDLAAWREEKTFQGLVQRRALGALPRQALSIPKLVQTTPFSDVQLQRLEVLGFEVENFGDGEAAVRGAPVGLSESRLEKGLALCANEAEERKSLEGLARLMAADAVETIDERQQCLSELPKLSSQIRAPGGQAVVLRLEDDAIQKHFGRVQRDCFDPLPGSRNDEFASGGEK